MYILTENCEGVVGCSFKIFELNRIINSKGEFFGLCHYCIQ